MHADSSSKLFFLHERPLLALEKILYFATIVETNKDSTHQSQNEDNFATFSLRLEFLKEAEKEKNNKRRLGISAVMICFTEQSLLIFFFFFRVGFDAQFTGYVIKQLVHAFSCALSSYGALGKFKEHSRS